MVAISSSGETVGVKQKSNTITINSNAPMPFSTDGCINSILRTFEENKTKLVSGEKHKIYFSVILGANGKVDVKLELRKEFNIKQNKELSDFIRDTIADFKTAIRADYASGQKI